MLNLAPRISPRLNSSQFANLHTFGGGSAPELWRIWTWLSIAQRIALSHAGKTGAKQLGRGQVASDCVFAEGSA